MSALKKIAVLLFSLLLLCSCRGGEPPAAPAIPEVFSATLKIRRESESFVCDAEFAAGGCKAVFSEPPSIAGLTLEISPGGCKAGFDGLESTFEQGAFPQTAFVQIICTALETIRSGAAAPVCEETVFSYDLSSAEEAYFVFQSRESGLPTFLQNDEKNIRVEFCY